MLHLIANFKDMVISLGFSCKTAFMSLEQYLSMTDEDFQFMTAYDEGYYVNSPFVESCLADLEDEEVDEFEDNTLFSNQDLTELLESEPD